MHAQHQTAWKNSLSVAARLQAWSDNAALSNLRIDQLSGGRGGQALHTMATLAVYVSASFAQEAGIVHGATFALQTKPERQSKDAIVPVCVHDAVSSGHIFMAKPLMRQLGLSPSSQVRLLHSSQALAGCYHSAGVSARPTPQPTTTHTYTCMHTRLTSHLSSAVQRDPAADIVSDKYV